SPQPVFVRGAAGRAGRLSSREIAAGGAQKSPPRLAIAGDRAYVARTSQARAGRGRETSVQVHRLGATPDPLPKAQTGKDMDMALPEYSMRQLLEAGVHYGHQTQ